MSRYTIPVMVISMNKKKGPCTLSLLRTPKQVHVWAATNIFQEDSWIFAVPDSTVLGIDITTDMKRALITENY
jgi:hypothetical protein